MITLEIKTGFTVSENIRSNPADRPARSDRQEDRVRPETAPA